MLAGPSPSSEIGVPHASPSSVRRASCSIATNSPYCSSSSIQSMRRRCWPDRWRRHTATTALLLLVSLLVLQSAVQPGLATREAFNDARVEGDIKELRTRAQYLPFPKAGIDTADFSHGSVAALRARRYVKRVVEEGDDDDQVYALVDDTEVSDEASDGPLTALRDTTVGASGENVDGVTDTAAMAVAAKVRAGRRLGRLAALLLEDADDEFEEKSPDSSSVMLEASSEEPAPPTTAFPTTTTHPPTTTTTTTRPPGRRRKIARLGLLGLLALLILVIIGGFIGWRIYLRNRNRRRACRIRLNGTRRPGEVDDVDMGQAVKGGEWLNVDAADGTTHIVGAGRRSHFCSNAVDTPGGAGGVTFDPIGQQTAAMRQRKRARRVAVAAAEGGAGASRDAPFDSAAGVFGVRATGTQGNESGVNASDTWSSEEEGDSEMGPAGGGGVAAALGPIYATSMVPPTTVAGGEGAGVAGKGTGQAAWTAATTTTSTTVVPPLSLSPQYFNETTKVLLDRYNAENETVVGNGGGGRGLSFSAAAPFSSAMAGDRVGSAANQAAKENSAFEHILSSAAAPLRVGQEFHQRGASVGSPAAAAAATTTAATPNRMTAAGQSAQPNRDSDEEYEEEDDDGDEEEEEGGDSDRLNNAPVRRPEVRHADPSAFQDAEPSDEEEGEEEEEEQEEEAEEETPPRGRPSAAAQGRSGASLYNGAANRSLR